MVGRGLSKNSELYDLLINRQQEFISNNFDQDTSKIAQLIKDSQAIRMKSNIILPVVYNNQTLALFALATVNKYKVWTADEIKLLKAVVNQMAIALYQRNLSDELNLSSNRIKESLLQEQCLKQIITKIRTCLNVHEVIDYVCAEIANFLGVDRVVILELNDEQTEILPVQAEYRINDDLPSFKFNNDSLEKLNKLIKICQKV